MKKYLHIYQELKNVAFIIAGSIILASGVSLFLLPMKIVAGGTPGMSIIVHYLTDISVGQAMIIINAPLILAGMKYINSGFAIKTVFSILVTALAIDFLPDFIEFQPIPGFLLSTFYGGACVGAGISLVIKGGASAGGTTIIARIAVQNSTWKPAQIILIFDTLIVVAISIIFKDMELALWSIISIVVTSKVIDMALTGPASENIVHIVSNKTNEIGNSISKELGRSGTILSGKTLTGHNNKLLFVVVTARELATLKSIILRHDTSALIIIMQASELMGSSLNNEHLRELQ